MRRELTGSIIVAGAWTAAAFFAGWYMGKNEAAPPSASVVVPFPPPALPPAPVPPTTQALGALAWSHPVMR